MGETGLHAMLHGAGWTHGSCIQAQFKLKQGAGP